MKDSACIDRRSSEKDEVIGEIDAHMQGDLKYVPLPSLMSFLEMALMSGSLRLEDDELVDVFYFKLGRVVDVESTHAERSSQKVLENLVQWTSGTFEFTCFAVDREDKINIPTSMLLIDCARRQDEERLSFESDELDEYFGDEFEEDFSEYEAEAVTTAENEVGTFERDRFQISLRVGNGAAPSISMGGYEAPISNCVTLTRRAFEIDTEIAWNRLGVINSSRAPPAVF